MISANKGAVYYVYNPRKSIHIGDNRLCKGSVLGEVSESEVGPQISRVVKISPWSSFVRYYRAFLRNDIANDRQTLCNLKHAISGLHHSAI